MRAPLKSPHGRLRSLFCLIPAVFALGSGSLAARDSVSERFFRFRWDPVQTAAVYEIQMSEKPAFDGAQVELESERPEKTVRLAPGRYFWRVRARDEQGRRGEWSPVRSLQYDPPPKPAPAASATPAPKNTAEAEPPATTSAAPAAMNDPPATNRPPTDSSPRKPEPPAPIRQRFDKKSGWESYALPPGKLLKIIFETADRGAGADKVLIKVNDRDFQTYPDDRLLLEHDGQYHITSYAVDRVGNRSAMRQRKILIDSTPPEIETRSGAKGLVLGASDGGVGLESLQWRTGPGDGWRTYSAPIPRAAAGAAGRIEIRAVDFLENSATKTFTFE